MIVSENGTHLPRCEIEDRSAYLVVDIGPFSPTEQEGAEFCSVSDQVVVD